MTVGEKYRELLKVRKEIDEVDYDNDPTIKEMIDMLCNNIDETIDYIKNDCSAEEFVYISELYDEIVDRTKSKAFIDCLYEVAKKYPKEVEEYNVMNFINWAANRLNEE